MFYRRCSRINFVRIFITYLLKNTSGLVLLDIKLVTMYVELKVFRPLFSALLIFQPDGECDLVSQGVLIGIGRYPVQTPLGARPGLRTQPRYQSPDDLRLET